MTEEAAFEPPEPTPGTTHCGGNHDAKARHELDGTITWVCQLCGKERVTRDGQGWR